MKGDGCFTFNQKRSIWIKKKKRKWSDELWFLLNEAVLKCCSNHKDRAHSHSEQTNKTFIEVFFFKQTGMENRAGDAASLGCSSKRRGHVKTVRCWKDWKGDETGRRWCCWAAWSDKFGPRWRCSWRLVSLIFSLGCCVICQRLERWQQRGEALTAQSLWGTIKHLPLPRVSFQYVHLFFKAAKSRTASVLGLCVRLAGRNAPSLHKSYMFCFFSTTCFCWHGLNT